MDEVVVVGTGGSEEAVEEVETVLLRLVLLLLEPGGLLP